MPHPAPTDWLKAHQDALRALTDYLDAIPGAAVVTVRTKGALAARFVVPPAAPPVFVPSPFHRAVLAALEGRALTGSQLARKLRCASHCLFNPSGLPTLRAQDPPLVVKGEHGYYRPDAPPPA
jgi:hypothetical protein